MGVSFQRARPRANRWLHKSKGNFLHRIYFKVHVHLERRCWQHIRAHTNALQKCRKRSPSLVAAGLLRAEILNESHKPPLGTSIVSEASRELWRAQLLRQTVTQSITRTPAREKMGVRGGRSKLARQQRGQSDATCRELLNADGHVGRTGFQRGASSNG